MDIFATETARWIFAAWFTFLGSAVGSFLNVVVYRLPERMSVAWPPSHCPRCRKPIRWYDNVPVLSWLWLGGRCRDCRKPISIRYPLVEAAMGGLFLLLLVVEAFHSGQNLPPRDPAALQQPTYLQGQALAICALHLGLICTLAASALMTLDGKRPPLRLFAPVAVVAFLAAIAFPWLRPQAALSGTGAKIWSGVMDSLFGLVIGYFLGQSVRWLGRRVAGLGRPGYQIQGEALLLGVTLGWQAALLLVLASMLCEELTRLAALRWTRLVRFTASVWLPPLVLVFILNWARLAAMLRSG